MAGLIDGFGSLITALMMVMIPIFTFGLFILFAITSFFSGLFVVGMAYREAKGKIKERKERKKLAESGKSEES